MNLNDISTFVSTVGFPIAVTMYLLWDSRQARKEHKEEMDHVSSVLENNTLVITKLSEKISSFMPKSIMSPKE